MFRIKDANKLSIYYIEGNSSEPAQPTQPDVKLSAPLTTLTEAHPQVTTN